MLIIPITGKLSWRNPPIVTLVLIILNCLVYVLFQMNDNRLFMEAEVYYFDSGLADIEVARYVEDRQLDVLPDDPEERLDPEILGHYRYEMRENDKFMARLRNEQVITPQDPEYEEWKDLRLEYEDRLGQITTMTYGFRPAIHRITTLFTYMFLHGGFGHLLGNMIFLWLVGCMLEIGCGRGFYATLYVITGLCAVGLFWLFNPQSTIPLVGASGAIAGMMGAFTVLYGRKRVKIFYSLGFYFNYVKLPAIILLPVWVLKEFYQLFFGGASQVAYLAHIGGLISGAAMGFINLKYLGAYHAEALAPEPVDEVSPLVEQALAHVAKLEMAPAADLLEQALAKEPDNIDVLSHLFNIRKNEPQTPAFHTMAVRLLTCLSQDPKNHGKAIEVYRDYRKVARRPRLSPALYLRIGGILAGSGRPEDAEKILAMFLKQKPQFPGVPATLMKLATSYKDKGNHARAQKCLTLLSKRYPESPEAVMAAKMLGK
jgi:membrane associated rhomboid family serine protease